MFVRRSTVLSALALPLAATLLVGCSSDSKTTTTRASGSATGSPVSASPSKTAADLSNLSAAELLTKSQAALTAADELRIKGSGTESGTKVTIDLNFKGKDSEGDISLNGAAFTVLSVSGSTYFKATDAFWKAQAGSKAATIIEITKGKWIKADPSNAQFKDLIDFVNRANLVDNYLKPDGTLSKGSPATINGVPCLTLKDSTGGELYVAKDDARPIELIGKGTDSQSVAFTYTGVTAPTAPAASSVIDASKIGG